MDELKTGVDELMAILGNGERISIADAAKRLRQTETVLQNWVDFLVEEKLVGIEYKFTTPYIYRNAPQKKLDFAPHVETMEEIRQQFLGHAADKSIPAEKLAELWEHHLLAAIESKQQAFRQECTKRSIGDADNLFRLYTERVIQEHGLRRVA